MQARIIIVGGPNFRWWAELVANMGKDGCELSDVGSLLVGARVKQMVDPELFLSQAGPELREAITSEYWDPAARTPEDEAWAWERKRARLRRLTLAGLEEARAELAGRVATVLRRWVVIRLPARLVIQYCWRPGRWKSLT